MSLLPSGRPEKIGEEEELARFFNNHKRNGRVGKDNDGYFAKPSLFIPDSYPNTSVSRISGLPQAETTKIGDQVEEKKEEGRAKSFETEIDKTRCFARGAAVLKNSALVALGQRAQADEIPLHHALILGWAGCNGNEKADNYKLQKSSRKIQAQNIAEQSDIIFFREATDKVFAKETTQ